MGAFNLPITARPHSKLFTLGTKVSAKDLAILAVKIKASNLTISKFLRAAALSATVTPPVQIPQINIEHWNDLARMGSNLNQIALQLNSIGEVDPYLYETIEQMRLLLAEVRAALINHGGPLNGV